VICLSAGLVCAQEAAPSDAQPVPAQPVSASHPYHNRRFIDSVKRLFSVEAITSTLPAAALQQAHDWPNEWGKHGSGFAKRVGSLYAQFVVGVAIEDSVKALHHEDTHFARQGHGNFLRRTAHVIVGTVVAHKPDGSLTPAWSLPANAYGSWAIATLWSPREYRNAASIFEWGSAGMGATAGLNFLREFWPDLKSVFRRK
jgi:hypothetical protein